MTHRFSEPPTIQIRRIWQLGSHHFAIHTKFWCRDPQGIFLDMFSGFPGMSYKCWLGSIGSWFRDLGSKGKRQVRTKSKHARNARNPDLQSVCWFFDKSCVTFVTFVTQDVGGSQLFVPWQQLESEIFSQTVSGLYRVRLSWILKACLSVCPSHGWILIACSFWSKWKLARELAQFAWWMTIRVDCPSGFRYIAHRRATRIEGGLNPGAGKRGSWRLAGGVLRSWDKVRLCHPRGCDLLISYQRFFVEHPSCIWTDHIYW